MRKLSVLLVSTALASGAPAQESAPIDGDLAYAATRIRPWKSARCDEPVLDYPRWEGLPVRRCDYSDIGVTVRTYMLNASREQLAQWVVTACHDAGATRMHSCIDRLVSRMSLASSNGIFPIAGYIPEPQQGNVCYVFRDGVTVWTERTRAWIRPAGGRCGTSDDDETTSPVARAWKFARIASTTRQEYTASGGPYPVAGTQWMDAVREEYKKAWSNPRNGLLSATAKAEKSRGSFR